MVRRSIVYALLAALVCPAVFVAPVRAQGPRDEIVRCESGWFGSYKRCNLPTFGGVELMREFSNRRCERGDTWGWDREGIWVDDGCRAEFRVFNDRRHDRRRGDNGAAVVVGAIAATAILAAILASKNDTKEDAPEAVEMPRWAVGRFHGYSPKDDTNIDVEITSDGRITGSLDSGDFRGHVSADLTMYLGSVSFSLKERSWGFVATQTGDGDNFVSFRRK
jgi:hypothetical protein